MLIKLYLNLPYLIIITLRFSYNVIKHEDNSCMRCSMQSLQMGTFLFLYDSKENAVEQRIYFYGKSHVCCQR